MGITILHGEHIEALVIERQTRLSDYNPIPITHVYVPMHRKYTKRIGLSERQIRKRLELQGWSSWRGGNIHLSRQEGLYPSVRAKYDQLSRLLRRYSPIYKETLELFCTVHHGMPDFLCYRQGAFKFVECKLGHEPLSPRQKTCIERLQQMGFCVEVHKLVEPCTKTRRAIIDLRSGVKKVLEQQLTIKQASTSLPFRTPSLPRLQP